MIGAVCGDVIGSVYEGAGLKTKQFDLFHPSAGPTDDSVLTLAVALAVFLARNGASKDELREKIADRFGYDLHRTVDSIRPGYGFEISCARSVPEALVAFLDSHDFEDAVRNAISLGGDADTQACISAAVAEAFYGGVPAPILDWVMGRLDDFLLGTARDFYARFAPKTTTSQALARAVAARGI